MIQTRSIAPAGPFSYAEGDHQQYLVKNPFGYGPANGTGVSCPVGRFTDIRCQFSGNAAAFAGFTGDPSRG